MRSSFRFIVKPVDGQYVNEVGGLTMNTSIEDYKAVNRIAEIYAVPFGYKGSLREKDKAVVHHNTFRIQYDNHGVPVNADNYIMDDLYFIDPDLIYMKIGEGKEAADGFCFVEPVFRDEPYVGIREVKHIGRMKYPCESVDAETGDVVVFRKFNEYEFLIDDERLYMMKQGRVLARQLK